MEIVLGVVVFVALVVVVWALLRQPDDPGLDEEEAAGAITANWDRLDDEL